MASSAEQTRPRSGPAAERCRRCLAALLVLLGLLAPALAPPPAVAQPGDAVSPAALLLTEARTLAAQGDDRAALALLARIAETFPDSPQAPEALLTSAAVARRLGDPAAARRTLARLAERHPGSPQAAGAALEAIELDLAAADSLQALAAAAAELAEIPRRWPGAGAAPTRAAARVRRGELLLLLGEPAAAAAALVVALEDEPASPWRARAALGLGRAELAAGRPLPAAGLLQLALDDPLADPAVAERARRLLSLVHRLVLRPLAGGPRWTTVSPVAIPGITLERPVAVAAADDGSLLIADAGADAVLELPAAGAPRRVAARAPREVFWDAAGGAWAIAGDSLLAVNAAEPAPRLSEPAEDRPLRDPAAAVRGLLGHWLLLSGRGDRLLLYDRAGRPLGPVSAGRSPVDVAQGGASFHVLERSAGSVVRFELDGTPGGAAVSGQRRPEALAVDPAGNVYVLDRGGNRIDLHSPGGELLQSLGPLLPGGIELRGPEDLAVDGSGRLYIADPRRREVLVLE